MHAYLRWLSGLEAVAKMTAALEALAELRVTFGDSAHKKDRFSLMDNSFAVESGNATTELEGCTFVKWIF